MDTQTAYSILELSGEKITKKTIKKAYFKQALVWHPDKNKNEKNRQRFHDIQSAYVFLNLNVEEDACENEDEEEDVSILSKFINITTGIDIDSEHMQNILAQLKKSCEEASFNLIEKLDKSTSIRIFDFLKQYYFLFGLEYASVEKLEKIIKPVDIITLTPNLESLFNNDIYKLETESGENYYIPLWHDELEFNNELSTLIVRVEPNLPESVVIDNDNNVHILKTICINELFGKEVYSITIASREFIIDIHKLLMKPKQIVCFQERGIAKVDTKTIFQFLELVMYYFILR